MLKFIFKRLIRAFGTLVALVLVAFFLLEFAPGDPLQKFNSSSEVLKTAKEYHKIKDGLNKRLGLNLPAFYFSITSQVIPDTLYKISLEQDQIALKKLLFKYGYWSQISKYYRAYNKLLEHNRNIQIEDKTLQLKCPRCSQLHAQGQHCRCNLEHHCQRCYRSLVRPRQNPSLR